MGLLSPQYAIRALGSFSIPPEGWDNIAAVLLVLLLVLPLSNDHVFRTGPAAADADEQPERERSNHALSHLDFLSAVKAALPEVGRSRQNAGTRRAR